MIDKVALFRAVDEYGQHVFPLFGEAEATFEKIAAPTLVPEVARFIETLRPRSDTQFVLVNAMGSGEFYGSNVNGDRFAESALVHVPPAWSGNPVWDRTISAKWPYGYPTFYNAHPYGHHRNKDPLKAYGTVELVAWNPRMHRVELVIALDKLKCQEHGGISVWDKVAAGMFPDVSMGTRVPFDTCSICLNTDLYQEALATFDPKRHAYAGKAVLEFHKALRARDGVGIRGLAITRKDYCDHARLQMNKIYPDGRKVCVDNDFPRFFDISFVFIGAEKCAKTMLKIKPLGKTEESDFGLSSSALEGGTFEKAASAKTAKTKGAEIVKGVVPSQFASQAVPLMTEREPDLPKSLIRIMSDLPLEESLGTTSSMGMILRPREFQRLILSKLGLEPEADRLESGCMLFPKAESGPPIMGPGRFSKLLAGLLGPMVKDRSLFAPAVEKRVTIIMLGKKPTIPATSPPSELLHKIGAAYASYRRDLMNTLTSSLEQPDSDISKAASVAMTPLSYAYLKEAYMDELGKEARACADAQRGIPFEDRVCRNIKSHGDLT